MLSGGSGRSVASVTVIDSDAPGGNGLAGREYTSADAGLFNTFLTEDTRRDPVIHTIM
jgi:hypothetical protein